LLGSSIPPFSRRVRQSCVLETLFFFFFFEMKISFPMAPHSSLIVDCGWPQSRTDSPIQGTLVALTYAGSQPFFFPLRLPPGGATPAVCTAM